MNLDKKQKILIPVTVVVLGILGWQIYGFMGENSASTRAAKSGAMRPVADSVARVNRVIANNEAGPEASSKPAAIISEQDKQRLKDVSQSDAEYLKLIQEYQLLQVQRRIAEDTRAIAVAKLETVKALAEASKFGGSGNSGPHTVSMGSMDTDYKLVFTGQEAGQWTATLKMNDQLMDVVTGTTLPDGYKVTAVDGDAVTLQRADKQKIISFLGVNESQVPKQAENITKQTNADALLQIIAPEKSKKTQPEITSPKPEAKTETAASAQTSQTNRTAMPVMQPAHNEQANNQAQIVNKNDKSALTAAFLGVEDPVVKQQKLAVKNEQVKPVANAPVEQKQPVVATSAQEDKAAKADNTTLSKPGASQIKDMPATSASAKSETTTGARPAVVKPQAKTVINTEKSLGKAVGNFTIQLMSDTAESAIKAFVSQNNLVDKANYFSTYIKGQKRYVLTYGSYATFEEAQVALQALPSALQSWQPFVRKLKGLKQVNLTKQQVNRQITSQPIQPMINQRANIGASANKTPSEISY
jgi:predicted transcriptional regulator